MSGKLKYLLGAAAAAAVIAAAAAAVFMLRGDEGLLTYVPKPAASNAYALIETKNGSFPEVFSSFFTEGAYAPFRKGGPRGAMLAAACAADEAAVLIERKSDGTVEVCCVLRFAGASASKLNKGSLPDELRNIFGDADVRKTETQGFYSINSPSVSAPIWYTDKGGTALFAADAAALRKMASLGAGSKEGFGGKKWSEEKDWPAHAEISDGGLLASPGSKYVGTITAEAAWHDAEGDGADSPAGELRWKITGLNPAARSYIEASLKQREWNASDCVIVEPLLLSAGLNIPKFAGDPENWPFPLSIAGEAAKSMNMTDSQVREILSGQTIFSLGGKNKILWFSVPGFIVEFSGREELMKHLVSSFWETFFFDGEPKPLEGFEYGGTENFPFFVVGAGRGGIAVLGLASPQSLRSGKALSGLVPDGEEAVGWMLADLPKIGDALSEMTKMSSFLEDEADEDIVPYDEEGGSSLYGPEPIQPEFSLTPFDQSITDSFSAALKKLGRILIVWEKPLSGRINWYEQAK